MNPATPSEVPLSQPQPITAALWSKPYVLPSLALALGLLLGIVLMAIVTPKPVNIHPLQSQATNLQQQAAYGRVMMLNYTDFDEHYNWMVTDANATNPSTATVEADATKLANSTQTYIKDLKNLTVPACLKATNTALLTGLTDIQQGASALDKALVANDAGQVSATGDQFSQGLALINTAEQDYALATC